ncbi:MAG: LPS export ABC transporter periplasmic protein LptC [Deltaproteobacteria bacterium]|nr:LPS export ABC transporter periplasmic protein LptC [Deltaproteobacteria bacterium]
MYLAKQVNQRHVQWLFLAMMAFYLSYLALSIILESRERKSLFSGGLFSNGASGSQVEQLAARDPVALHLKEFHRVEVRDGQPIWEVKAKDAKYYSVEGFLHVSDAKVIVYRPGGQTFEFHCKAGKLYVESNVLRRAEMEGEVALKLDTSLSIRTAMATYDVDTSIVTAPGLVNIDGATFMISGIGLNANMLTRVVALSKDVSSSFQHLESASSGQLKKSLGVLDKK